MLGVLNAGVNPVKRVDRRSDQAGAHGAGRGCPSSTFTFRFSPAGLSQDAAPPVATPVQACRPTSPPPVSPLACPWRKPSRGSSSLLLVAMHAGGSSHPAAARTQVLERRCPCRTKSCRSDVFSLVYPGTDGHATHVGRHLLRRVATVGVRNGACPRGFARAAGGPTPVLEFDEVFVPGKPGCMAPWMSFADIIDRISRLQPGHLPVPTGTRLTSADIAGIRSNPLTSAQDGEVPRFSSRRWPHPSAGVRRSLRGQETLQEEPVVVLEGI